MQEGSVVIAVIQQANAQLKRRPAIVLRELPGYHDFLICGVSSQLHQAVKGFDEIISRADSDFVASGLQSNSLIRLGHLMAISPRYIEGEIGSISPKRRNRLLKNLSNYLVKKP